MAYRYVDGHRPIPICHLEGTPSTRTFLKERNLKSFHLLTDEYVCNGPTTRKAHSVGEDVGSRQPIGKGAESARASGRDDTGAPEPDYECDSRHFQCSGLWNDSNFEYRCSRSGSGLGN